MLEEGRHLSGVIMKKKRIIIIKLDSLHCCIGDDKCYMLSKQMLYVTIYVV